MVGDTAPIERLKASHTVGSRDGASLLHKYRFDVHAETTNLSAMSTV
jgi:hypothetical protein